MYKAELGSAFWVRKKTIEVLEHIQTYVGMYKCLLYKALSVVAALSLSFIIGYNIQGNL